MKPSRPAKRRPRRRSSLALLLPFAALLSVATFSLHSPDRLGPTAVTVTAAATDTAKLSSSSTHRLAISGLDLRAINATPPLHAAAVRAFRSGGRHLRDVLSVSAAAAPPATSPAPPRCPPSIAQYSTQLRGADVKPEED